MSYDKEVNLDLSKLSDPALFIAAAETEDELGCVLRFHLAVEKILVFYIMQHLILGKESYIKVPREYGARLSYAVALGLPIPLAAVARQINNMRNPLAHGDKAALDSGNVQQLGRLVDALCTFDENHKPLNQRYLELPVAHPGQRITYGSGDLRLDFVLAAVAFLVTAKTWVVKDAAFLNLMAQ